MESKVRSGLDYAIELTVGIASRLNPKLDKSMRMDLVYSIFDDQLKAVTDFNRQQRHEARKLLKKAMRSHDAV